MFERFTDRARRVVVLAQEEARLLNHNYIGTEHLLLGLIREHDGIAAKAIESFHITLEQVRADVEEIIGPGQAAPAGHIPFTPRAKKVLELSLREALQLAHNFIGTEHLLLGLIHESEGVATEILEKRGASLERVRQTVIQLISGYEGGTEDQPPRAWTEELRTETEPVAPLRSVVRTEDFPTCPCCFASLAETATVRRLDAESGGPERVEVTIVYCGRCGTALGTA